MVCHRGTYFDCFTWTMTYYISHDRYGCILNTSKTVTNTAESDTCIVNITALRDYICVMRASIQSVTLLMLCELSLLSFLWQIGGIALRSNGFD